MKRLLYLFLLVITFNVYSQDSFTWDSNGLSPDYIVSEFPNMSQEELYKQTLYYLKETYRDPDEVIKTTIENELIRISAVDTDMFCFRALGISNYTCEAGHYTISFEFKDGKIKIEPIELYYVAPPSQYSSGGRKDVNLDGGSGMYKKNGKIRSAAQDIPESIESTFNELLAAHKMYVNGTHPVKQDEDW